MAVKKDVDTILWKYCFYREIEDFRQSLKKAAKNSEVTHSMSDAYLMRLSAEFEMRLGTEFIASYLQIRK
jgi:hypothetical protein